MLKWNALSTYIIQHDHIRSCIHMNMVSFQLISTNKINVISIQGLLNNMSIQYTYMIVYATIPYVLLLLYSLQLCEAACKKSVCNVCCFGYANVYIWIALLNCTCMCVSTLLVLYNIATLRSSECSRCTTMLFAWRQCCSRQPNTSTHKHMVLRIICIVYVM